MSLYKTLILVRYSVQLEFILIYGFLLLTPYVRREYNKLLFMDYGTIYEPAYEIMVLSMRIRAVSPEPSLFACEVWE